MFHQIACINAVKAHQSHDSDRALTQKYIFNVYQVQITTSGWKLNIFGEVTDKKYRSQCIQFRPKHAVSIEKFNFVSGEGLTPSPDLSHGGEGYPRPTPYPSPYEAFRICTCVR